MEALTFKLLIMFPRGTAAKKWISQNSSLSNETCFNTWLRLLPQNIRK